MGLNIQDNLQWLGEKFSPGVAWIDLQLLADNGTVKTSFRALASRWKWSPNKVIRFLNGLERAGIVETSHGTFHGTITEQLIILKPITCNDSGTIAERSTEHKEGTLNGPSPIPTRPSSPIPPTTHTPVTTPPIIPQEPEREKRPRKKVFIPPTVDEVRKYCEERKNGIDPQDFVDYYTTNGWVQGDKGKPIVDWKACVRTWENKRKHKQQSLFDDQGNPHIRGPKFSDSHSYINEQGFPRNSRPAATEEEKKANFQKTLAEYYEWVEECKKWDEEHK